jgi:MFS family permease
VRMKLIVVSDNHVGDISVAFNCGLMIGAFTWGMLVDIVGRRWCFNLTCLVASISGFLFACESVVLDLANVSAFKLGIGMFLLRLYRVWSRWQYTYRRDNYPGVLAQEQAIPSCSAEYLPGESGFVNNANNKPVGTVAATLIAYVLIPSRSCEPGLPSCKFGVTPCCSRSANMGW